jgi:hypothetical protein
LVYNIIVSSLIHGNVNNHAIPLCVSENNGRVLENTESVGSLLALELTT